jgi:predicted transcriptional regulator
MTGTDATPDHSVCQVRLIPMLRALANPTRLLVVEMLAKRQLCRTHQIVAVTGLAQSTVSQHMKVLVRAELIYGTQHGAATCYQVDAAAVLWLKRQFQLWLHGCC